MKISIITPSVRPDFLPIVEKCLDRQTLKDFEWLVGSPEDYGFGRWIKDPPKKEGDFYSLNKCWNSLFKQAKGELIISIVDGLWFPPDTLEKLWTIYEFNPKACVTCVGHQYDQIVNGKPEHLVWKDPRVKDDALSFRQVSPTEMELCIASLPCQAIYDVGGVDEEFDKYAALSEKEMCWRMAAADYEFYLDQSIEYRAIYHPRLSEEWDKKYFEGCEYFSKCLKEIQEGKRLALDFLDHK